MDLSPDSEKDLPMKLILTIRDCPDNSGGLLSLDLGATDVVFNTTLVVDENGGRPRF